jgi:hypothetical protein
MDEKTKKHRSNTHLCCELCLGALELLKGKLGDLCDDVVDGGLKAGWRLLGDVVGNLMRGGGGHTSTAAAMSAAEAKAKMVLLDNVHPTDNVSVVVARKPMQ